MSSHRISASGDRPFTLNAGGGPFSAFSVPSKKSDGIAFTASGFKTIEVPLLGNVRVKRVKITTKTHREGEEPTVSELLVLVIGDEGNSNAHLSMHGYPATEEDGMGPENTNLDIRKPGEQFGAFSYYGSVEVVEENVLPEA